MARRSYLLVGEGPHDIGRASDDPDSTGVLTELLHTLLEQEAGIPRVAMAFNSHRVKDIRTHGRGLAGKVRAAMALAEIQGADAVFVVVDRDGPANRSRLPELKQGRSDGRAKAIATPTVVGCAVEAVEAWVLGDAEAVSRVLGVRVDHVPAHPETLAGKRTSGKHPKDVLRDLIRSSRNSADDLEGVYVRIAQETDVKLLQEKCPEGFGELARDMRSELGLRR